MFDCVPVCLLWVCGGVCGLWVWVLWVARGGVGCLVSVCCLDWWRGVGAGLGFGVTWVVGVVLCLGLGELLRGSAWVVIGLFVAAILTI